MKLKQQDSGTKHTVKVIPETVREFVILVRLLGTPSPCRGTKNLPHWHVKETK